MGRVLVQQPGTNTTKASTEILPKNVIIVDEDLHQLRLHDGITPGGHVIGSSGGGNNSNALLSFMWADHQLNDVSWLRADTFSWQSGDVYVAAYNHLAGDYESATTGYSWTGDETGNTYISKGMPSVGDTLVNGAAYTVGGVGSNYITVHKNGTPYETATLNSAVSGINTSQTETIGDITITYYLADDGHKICLPDQESNLVALYNTTGVAWYYILDTTNRQFKLPRTKWGFTGLRDSVGGYVPQNVLLPNITGVVTGLGDVSVSGAFTRGPKVAGNGGGNGSINADRFDASRSSSVYSGNGTNTLIQPPATQMYLYFYVGNFEQSAIEQTAGITAETLNGKADRNLLNTTDNVDIVIESQFPTADNGYTWYRKYKSGWVEQGGIVFPTTTTPTRVSITLPVIMSSDVYSVQVTGGDNTAEAGVFSYYTNRTTTGFEILYSHTTTSYTIGDSWQVSGMAAQ